MDSFTSALRDALQVSDRAESSDGVHQVVINQVRQLDPEAVVRRTGYFNHSWVPDFDLTWRDGEHRHMFLRFDVFDGSFADDLRWAQDHDDPVFLDIAQPDLGLERAAAQIEPGVHVNGELGETRAMVTEHRAFGRLGTSVSRDLDSRTATRQLVRGGRGMVDDAVAQRVLAYYQQAREFLAPDRLAETDPAELRAVLNQLEEPLSRTASLDLESALRVRWVQGGREPELFPSLEAWTLGDRHPEEIASLVLALVEAADDVAEDRWREIAQAISADQLGAAARGRRRVTGGKLNDLVRVARDYWTAKWAWVPTIDVTAETDAFNWSLGGTALELNLVSHRAVFSDIGTRFNMMPKPEELPHLEPRLETLDDASVIGISIVSPEETVGVQLRTSATETLGERLRRLMAEQADIRIRGRIARLDIRLPGSTAIATIDFESGKVHCSDAVPLAAFSRLIGRYMVDLPQESLRTLDERLAAGAQPPPEEAT